MPVLDCNRAAVDPIAEAFSTAAAIKALAFPAPTTHIFRYCANSSIDAHVSANSLRGIGRCQGGWKMSKRVLAKLHQSRSFNFSTSASAARESLT